MVVGYGAELISVIFFVMFGLAVVYMALCSAFLDEIEMLDEDVAEARWSSKSTKLLLKYIFFVKESRELPRGAGVLLIWTRVVFVLGMSSYLLLLLLIFSQ